MEMRRIAVLSLVVVTLLGGAPSVLAQGTEGITVRPALLDERANPGQVVTQVINVTNEGDESTTFYPRVRDIESMDEVGRPVWVQPGTESTGAEISSWTSFSLQQIDLAPGQTAEVAVTFNVPGDAPHGGFFGMIGFERTPSGVGEESGLGIGFTTGMLVSLRVGEDAFDDARVVSFRSTDRLSGGSDTSFETRLENTGNALIRPTGWIQISNMFGEQVTSVSFNPTAGGILPGATRRYETNWSDDGTYFGRYEALLIVGYGTDEKKTLTATTTFWVIPGRLTLIVGIAVLILFLVVFGWSRMYIRRRLREAGAPVKAGSSASSGTVFIAALIAVIVTAVVLLGFAFFFLV